MLRRSTALQIGGFRKEYELAQDFDMLLRLAEVGQLANLPQKVISYRLRMDSAGNSNMQRQRTAAMLALTDACKRRRIRHCRLLETTDVKQPIHSTEEI